MQTLIIVAHPAIAASGTQSFLKASAQLNQVTWHALAEQPHFTAADIKAEQALLLAHDRIIFQFPFYWYSAPWQLKAWQDQVLTANFTYEDDRHLLAGKEFGLVITTGVKQQAYQAGGTEVFSMSALTSPFQALANKCGMLFLPNFVISRFPYLSEDEQKKLLVTYQQYLTMPQDHRFSTRENWFIERLTMRRDAAKTPEQANLINHVLATLVENREAINELNWTIEMMKEQD